MARKKNIKVFKFMPPYNKDGKTTFPKTRGRKGVYLIKENSKLVYVGESGKQLYKTIYRHFQHWIESSLISGRPIYHTTYYNKLKKNRYTVRVIFTNTAAQAARLERALIIKHKPRDNRQKYDQYKLDFHDNKIVNDYKKAAIEEVAPF